MTETSAAACPFRIDRPVMRQRWQRLTFLHWQFEPPVVQRLLPGWLQPELFDGAAWVGLVPFFMHVATPGGRELPWVSRFCETNVRTYVRDRAGRTGIWFCSLDAERLGAVAVARSTYKLPYFWSQMRLAGTGDRVSYRCRRKLPGPRSATSAVSIDIGDRYQDHELGARDHFLTARWILFTTLRSRPTLARASHQPWPLHRARVRELDDRLIAAAGLPAPQDPPLVHYSPGVDVAIGRPEHGD
ncbi:MAG: YqjF family protein [Streptosporangiaceae bacterium]